MTIANDLTNLVHELSSYEATFRALRHHKLSAKWWASVDSIPEAVRDTFGNPVSTSGFGTGDTPEEALRAACTKLDHEIDKELLRRLDVREKQGSTKDYLAGITL